jgi:hypothetical protein
MSIITKVLRQRCVYWPPLGSDQFGEQRLGRPVELKCRWDDNNEEFISVDGTRLVGKGRVMVSSDVEPLGYLWLGTLASLPSHVATECPAAQQIMQFQKVPNFRATEFVRTAIF